MSEGKDRVKNGRWRSPIGAFRDAGRTLHPGSRAYIAHDGQGYYWCTEEDKALLNKAVRCMQVTVGLDVRGNQHWPDHFYLGA